MEKLKIIVKGHSKIEGHIIYELSIQFDDDISFTVQKRYSELKTMHDSLRRETNSNSFPKFPPKKFFGIYTEEFLKKRQQDLDAYFQAICKSSEFSKLPSFVKFIDDCLKSQNDNKLLSERPTSIMDKRSNIPRKTKSTIDSYRLRFKPDKKEYNLLSLQDMKKEEPEFQKIVNDSKNKFIDICFQVKQNISEENEKKYNDIIKADNILNDENDSDNIQEGNDNNFNLISDKSDNSMETEKYIRQKMEEALKKQMEFILIYDINKN